ncbi:MAG: glycosyltransferase [Kiritimatiellae bacterium]|nr:glycosyltransferase [Kiritimatiellia bacterium]
MNIAIDARWIFPEIFGIGAYTHNIISQLVKLDNQNNYTLLFNNIEMRKRVLSETGADKSPSFSAIDLSYGIFSISNQLLLPALLKRMKIDVFHSPNYMIPFLAFPRHKPGRTKCVVTIHDVIPLVFPHHAPKSRKSRFSALYRLVMSECAARADTIITDSHASTTDIIKHLKIQPQEADKVTSVYCGINTRFKPAETPQNNTISRLIDKSNGAKNILYVGRMDPYKNISTLLKALATARKNCGFQISLTIAGGLDPRYPETPKLAEELGISNAVKWTGYLSNKDLLSLYQHCDLLVHPSRYEGFGLTVAEAMSCGLPVICSNTGPMPEVAGNAAIMLDPDDIDGFTNNICKVLTNPALAAEMKEKGLEQSAKFTWKQTGTEILRLYQHPIPSHPATPTSPNHSDKSPLPPIASATKPPPLKVTLGHDWLTGMRGGERVLEIFCELFPNAPIITLINNRKAVSDTINSHNITSSALQSLPGIFNSYRNFLPLFPWAISRLDVPPSDLLLTTSHCIIKGLHPKPGTKHICYCFTPMRYAWTFYDEYFGNNPIKAMIAKPLLAMLRTWDKKASVRVDHFVAISRHVQKRIKDFYGRESDVVYPPVDTERCIPTASPEQNFDLIVSALVPYKRVDLAVNAYTKSGYPLKIVGTGGELNHLKSIAGSNIQFLEWQSDETIVELYQNCRMLIFPGEEDFGIVPLEAQSCGRPVVAYAKGGALETIQEDLSGIFFKEQTEDSLQDAINRCATATWDPAAIHTHAQQFDTANFITNINKIISKVIKA